MPVESVQFVHASVFPGGASAATYTVPVGFLAVVTDIQCYSPPSGRRIALVAFSSDVAGVAQLYFDSETDPVALWHGRVALLAGDNLYTNVLSANGVVEVSVSGYLYS